MARKLLSKTDDWAVERGLNAIGCHTLDFNIEARSLYESLGYKLIAPHNESYFYEKKNRCMILQQRQPFETTQNLKQPFQSLVRTVLKRGIICNQANSKLGETMRPRFKYLPILGILIVAGTLSVWYFYPRTDPALYDEGFEQGFGDWEKAADLPLDPNNPGYFVTWNISRVTSLSSSGQYSLELFIDGRQDDGTIWIEKELPVKSNSQIHVTISFDFYSEQESFNAIAGVCAYAGISDPTLEEDFVVLGPANEVAGWKRYTHEKTLITDSSGNVWVALGITVTWETEMTYNVDDVTITIT